MSLPELLTGEASPFSPLEIEHRAPLTGDSTSSAFSLDAPPRVTGVRRAGPSQTSEPRQGAFLSEGKAVQERWDEPGKGAALGSQLGATRGGSWGG